MKTLKAFHNSAEIKQKYIDRIEQHIKADQLIHGVGWDKETNRGCAVGCTLNKYDCAAYEKELGLPEWLAYLEDTLFENISLEKSRIFPKLFLESIPVGVNLDKAYHKFCKFILTEVIQMPDDKQTRDAIQKIILLHEKAIRGEITTIPALIRSKTISAALSALSAARSATWITARSAVLSALSAARLAAWKATNSTTSAAWLAVDSTTSAAWSVTWITARSAAHSAESAARSAALSALLAARSAAWKATWITARQMAVQTTAHTAIFDRMADKLLEILAESES